MPSSWMAARLVILLWAPFVHAWIQYPSNGFATMTHYQVPGGFVASCGCVANATFHPVAAMNQLAYGSSMAYGPACGQCFNLTLLNTFLSSPPFFPDTHNSVVVKIVDMCPLFAEWCSATESKPNPSGNFLNFDLAWPSSSISENFFPSNAALYGYTDFGVWNISYDSISCDSWAGSSDSAALGSVPTLGDGACCPADPFNNASELCPSFSDAHGIPPDQTPKVAGSTRYLPSLHTWTVFWIACIMLFSRHIY